MPVEIRKVHPAAYRSMGALSEQAEAAIASAGLDPLLAELVKIRVSQINGCAYCLRLHARDAVAMGETSDRLAVIAAWWESQYFTAQERAALALAEHVTAIADPVVRAWDDGSLSDEQVSAVTWLAIVMNAWNRIAITTHTPVAP